VTDLFPALGRPTLKSMKMSVHIEAGMGSGCRVPGDLKISPLLHWHTSH
jgi:hypothetical protein